MRWIIKEIDTQEKSIYSIAKIQDITPQWTRELHRRWHTTSEYPYPKKSGRKPSPITPEEKQLVFDTYRSHPLAAVTMEKILAEQDIHIGHNSIHRILKEKGLAKDEPHKQHRRSYVRYERRYSNGLWHEDDASRFITGSGVFQHATAQNAVTVFLQAIQAYGIPKQVMTDHGTQFTSLPRDTCTSPRL